MQLHESSGGTAITADTAIEGLYAAHWRPLVRLAWLLVHDQGDAEDVVQDAFVATHRHWDLLRDQAAATAYLRRCVVNGCRSLGRHQLVVRRELSAAAGRADAPGRDVSASAEAAALAELGDAGMLTALHALAPRQREVLVLPKRHLQHIAELVEEPEELADLFRLAADVAADEGLERGYRIVTNTGSEGGQTVYHAHLHLFGGRRMVWPPG